MSQSIRRIIDDLNNHIRGQADTFTVLGVLDVIDA